LRSHAILPRKDENTLTLRILIKAFCAKEKMKTTVFYQWKNE
jgi:hypothetical protein